VRVTTVAANATTEFAARLLSVRLAKIVLHKKDNLVTHSTHGGSSSTEFRHSANLQVDLPQLVPHYNSWEEQLQELQTLQSKALLPIQQK